MCGAWKNKKHHKYRTPQLKTRDLQSTNIDISPRREFAFLHLTVRFEPKEKHKEPQRFIILMMHGGVIHLIGTAVVCCVHSHQLIAAVIVTINW